MTRRKTSPQLSLVRGEGSIRRSVSTSQADPRVDAVPRWQVFAMSAVGTDAYKLIATDGDGYTLYESILPLSEAFPGEREKEIQHLQRKLEFRRRSLGWKA